jgi:hypothetical protein
MSQRRHFNPQFRFTGGDRLVLYIPFIAILAVIAEIVFKIATGANPFSFLDANLNELFINIFLLNSLHLVFPFMILILLPQGRDFIRIKRVRWSQNWMIGLSVVFFISVLFLVSLQSIKHLNFLEPFKVFIGGSMVWVWYLVPTFHGMRQSAGISQLLGSSRFDENPKYIYAKKIDRKLLRFYYCGVMGTFIWQKWGVAYPHILWIMSAMTLLLGIAIIYNSKIISTLDQSDKYIFSYRFLLWPLQPFSQIVIWSVIFNHGIEYIVLIQHMLKGTSEKVRSKKMFVASIFLGMSLISFYNIFHYVYGENPSWVAESWIFSIFMALYPFLTLLHYAIDSVVYRMSDPDVQNSMGRFFKIPSY